VKKPLLILLAVGVAEVLGGIAGWFLGMTLGDLGGRMDPENVWAWSAIFGAAAGLLLALAVLAAVRFFRRRSKRRIAAPPPL
jgi:MYXO-CTERM domain-containing protein